jgi:hypothetical protein
MEANDGDESVELGSKSKGFPYSPAKSNAEVFFVSCFLYFCY